MTTGPESSISASEPPGMSRGLTVYFRLTVAEAGPVRATEALGKDGAASHLSVIGQKAHGLRLRQNQSDHKKQRRHRQA